MSPGFFKSTPRQKDIACFYSPVKISKNLLVAICRKAEGETIHAWQKCSHYFTWNASGQTNTSGHRTRSALTRGSGVNPCIWQRSRFPRKPLGLNNFSKVNTLRKGEGEHVILYFDQGELSLLLFLFCISPKRPCWVNKSSEGKLPRGFQTSLGSLALFKMSSRFPKWVQLC